MSRPVSQSSTSSTQSSAVGAERCSSCIRAPLGSPIIPTWCSRSTARHTSGCSLTSVSHGDRLATNRASSHCRNGIEPNVGSVSWVISSRNRSASSFSQSSSLGVGVVSQASSTNGARSPTLTTAGIETR